MEQDITTDDAVEVALGLLSRGELFLASLLRPWNAYQIGIVLAIFLAAHVFARILVPRLSEWLRTREGWPKWRMRLAITLRNRLRLILFVAMIWPIVWVMQEVTLTERSQLLSATAQLTLAWLVIAVLTRIIANAVLRSLVRYVGWAWVSLSILGVVEDITSILDRVAIEIGEIRLSLWMILQAIMLLAVLFTLARFITKQSTRRIQSNADISPSMQVLAVKALQVGLYGAAVFIGLRVVGVDLTGLAVLSGAIGLGLGFGLQKVVSNLVSGVIILLDKSIKPGDVISLGETFGWINSLGARYVSVVTRDGLEYLIPNEDLITGQVVNWSHSNEFVRLDIHFGTAYGDDPHLVRRVAIEAALGVDRVLDFKSPVCHIIGFGDSSVDYVLRFWIKDPTQGLTNIRGNVYLALWDAFKANGISIPFPQREVRLLGQGPEDASMQADD